MTFRKDASLLYEYQIVLWIFAGLSVGLCFLMTSLYPLILATLFAVLALVSPAFFKEYITMDETGIVCHKENRELWAYSWGDIAMLKHSSHCCLPCITILTCDPKDKSSAYQHTGHFIMLSKTARKALKIYYNGIYS